MLDNLREGKLKEKVLVIHWAWSQRGWKDNSRFPDTVLRMELGSFHLRSSGRGLCLPSAYLLPWEQLPLDWRGCLMELWSGTKAEVKEGRLVGYNLYIHRRCGKGRIGDNDLWWIHWKWREGRLQLVFCCSAKDQTGRVGLWEQMRSLNSLPGLPGRYPCLFHILMYNECMSLTSILSSI